MGPRDQPLRPGVVDRQARRTIRIWASSSTASTRCRCATIPAGIADIPGEKIFFLQLADAPLLVMDVLQWARHYRSFPGQGQFDLENFLAQSLRAGYTGPLSLEIFNESSAKRRTGARQSTRCARCCTSKAGCASGSRQRAKADGEPAEAAARVLGRVELFDPPAATRLFGIAFLEFAVDELRAGARRAPAAWASGAPAGTARRTSRCTGRVASPDPQCGARLSFARAHFDDRHVGLRDRAHDGRPASRARTARRRCRAAVSTARPGRTRPRFPPSSRPDGTSSTSWTRRSAPTGCSNATSTLERDAAEPSRSAARRVDHVAFGLPIDRLDTWVLFCRAVLGMEPGASLELADPYGLIRSAGVANAERNVRFVLNVSLSQRTRTARTVERASAASACTTSRLTARTSSDRRAPARGGVEFVPISANYYDDLVASSTSTRARVERMRELGILYDQSPDGDYFHIYADEFRRPVLLRNRAAYRSAMTPMAPSMLPREWHRRHRSRRPPADQSRGEFCHAELRCAAPLDQFMIGGDANGQHHGT